MENFNVRSLKSAEKADDASVLLETFMASAPLGISIYDTSLRYRRINESLARIHGISVEAHIGHRISEILPRLAEHVEPFLSEVLRTGKPILNHETAGEILDKKQPNRCWLANYYPIIKDQKILGVGVAVLDISDRRIAEQESKNYLHLLQAVMDGTADAIFVKDRSAKYVFMSQAGAKLLGKPIEEIIGCDDSDFFETEVADLMRSRDEEVMASGRAMVFEDEVYLAGKKFVFQTSKSPYRNDKSEVVGLMGITRDITLAKQFELQTEMLLQHEQEARETLERANQSLRLERDLREQFVSALTHDLRNPLSAALAGAQTLPRVIDDPEAIQSLSIRIVESLNRLDQMIRDLLDANQVRAGERLPLKFSSTDMKRLLVQVVRNLRTLHGERIQLLVPREECEGVWSPEGITRIVENLCTNAVRYGDSRSSITVRLSCISSEVQISVHNEGPPISPEDQKTLFNPFRRAPSAKMGSSEGWGLGLTIVRGLVEAHFGKYRLESSAEQGTTFFISLPRDSSRPTLSV